MTSYYFDPARVAKETGKAIAIASQNWEADYVDYWDPHWYAFSRHKEPVRIQIGHPTSALRPLADRGNYFLGAICLMRFMGGFEDWPPTKDKIRAGNCLWQWEPENVLERFPNAVDSMINGHDVTVFFDFAFGDSPARQVEEFGPSPKGEPDSTVTWKIITRGRVIKGSVPTTQPNSLGCFIVYRDARPQIVSIDDRDEREETVARATSFNSFLGRAFPEWLGSVPPATQFLFGDMQEAAIFKLGGSGR